MSKIKEFSPETWNKIKNQIDRALSEVEPPWYAAFDADGTLWSHDAGNRFFDYEIDNKLLPLPPDPWAHVYGIKAKSPETAFLWLAQIHRGVPLKTVREWSEKCFAKEKANYPYLDSVRELVEYLQFKDVECIIVTASVKWSVEAPAKSLGIDPNNVLGVKTKIINGIVSDIQDGPVTYRHGKVDALLERTSGKKPILGIGNTDGDLDLISAATHVQIAVSSSSPDSKVFPGEQRLQEHAKAHHWITHRF